VEKELRKAFEKVTTNNVKAILDHNNVTRDRVRDLEHEIEQTNSLMLQYEQRLCQLQAQITALQAIVYKGGTT